MSIHELRDLGEARRFLLQGLWWQRVAPPTAATVRPALEWALQAASGGQALPPLGFLADLGQAAFGARAAARLGRSAVVPGLPINVVRTYEDHVLGKFYADESFGRAADALRRTEGRDRTRGLAFVLDRFHERLRLRRRGVQPRPAQGAAGPGARGRTASGLGIAAPGRRRWSE